MTLNLPPLPVGALAPLPAFPPPLPVLKLPDPWHTSPATNPSKPGWYPCRWRIEFPEARMYWDGVWWCTADPATGELRRLEHINIRNWSCEWCSPTP